MDMSLIHIVLLFLTAAAYMAAGRMMLTHTSTKPLYASPLNCFVLGVAIWFLWFLVFNGFLGVSLPVVWYTFLISTMALSIVLTRILNAPHENPLFWPKVCVGVLLTLPAFWVLRADAPMLWAELGHILKNTHHLLAFSGLPAAEDATNLGMTGALTQLGIPLLSLPVMVMADTFLPAVPTLFSLIIYILAGAELLKQCHVNIRPHNLLALSVVGLVAISLLNPFFINTLVFSAYPDVLLAALLFALALPLMDKNPLPTGLGLFPYAVMLAFLPALTPLALPLAGVFVLLYMFLLWRDKGIKTSPTRAAMGMLVTILMPLLTVSGLAFTAQRLGYKAMQSDVLTGFALNPSEALWGFVVGGRALMLASLGHPGIGVVVLLLFSIAVLRAVNLRFGESLDTVFAQKRQVMVPVLLVFIYAVALGGMYRASYTIHAVPFTQGGLHSLLHLQFLLLLPIWVWVHNAYRELVPPQSDTVSGSASVAMAVLFLAFLAVNSNTIRQPTFPALDHTLQVAKAMKADNNHVGWTAQVAVLDGTATKGYYSNALAYGLRHHAKVQPVMQAFADAAGRFDAFHDTLIKEDYDYLWIHAVTPDIGLVLGDTLRPDTSYLFKVTPDGLISTNTYSHAGYTSKQAAFVPRY